ncbi:hypothetical protein CYMTET_24784 [Cymbomonas tetramitiformis]|uniref:Legumain n=1 Tax=Cymbomonas tetramitiformis TaxID=36881 RepID=A0AAE0FVV5_9CHLO|nr:hypothetical protein CYMTET_24784 [Cymbomonas tetramitiformis]
MTLLLRPQRTFLRGCRLGNCAGWGMLIILLTVSLQPSSCGRVPPVARPHQSAEATPPGRIWALLVAGSRGWSNYRHQAQVYRMYQVLHMGNVPDSNIIMMHYNDLANNNLNPYPGKVFNSIGGPDVYHKTWADYSGGDVTASNFLAALQGRKQDVKITVMFNRPVCKGL